MIDVGSVLQSNDLSSIIIIIKIENTLYKYRCINRKDQYHFYLTDERSYIEESYHEIL
jgi:hypothetical protein